MSDEFKSNPVDYARRVYAHTLDWYKNADTKAEIILALDGIFLAFVTGSLFAKQSDLEEIIQTFTGVTWFFLILMSICLIASVVTAIICLWSRISLSDKVKIKFLMQHQIDIEKAETYVPEATHFFQGISWLNSKAYLEFLKTVDSDFELAALADSIHILSNHVLQKHRYVDWSFALAGGGLLSFFAVGISYLLAL